MACTNQLCHECSITDSHVQVVFLKIWVVDLPSAVVAVLFSTFLKVSHSLFYSSMQYIGLINAPKRQRMVSGLRHVRNRAPFLGGNFGLWGGIFSSCDCMLISYRQKDDPYNAIMAGFITGGVLAIRGGASVAMNQAFFGGVVLLLIEGASQVMMAQQMRQQHKMK